MATTITFSRDDLDLLVELAGCSLDEKPGSNWVQGAGGLPEYICEIARAIHRGGKSVSQSIAIAVSRVKKWAAGVGVNADTQAKAAKALAQWEALKAKSKAKTGAKKAALTAQPERVLCLTDYNMDDVRSAFQNRLTELRREWRKAHPNADYEDGPRSLYVREVWNTFLIARSDYGDDADLYKVPYTVADSGEFTFGDAVEVKTQYVEVADDDLGTTVDDATLASIAAMSHTNRVVSGAVARPAGGLARILALTGDEPTAAVEGDEPEAAEQPLSVNGTPVAVPEYADPGHQADGKARYQLKTPAQIKAAWAMVNQTLNGRKYQPWQLAHIKANIQAAAAHRAVDLAALSAVFDAYPATARILALTVEE